MTHKIGFNVLSFAYSMKGNNAEAFYIGDAVFEKMIGKIQSITQSTNRVIVVDNITDAKLKAELVKYKNYLGKVDTYHVVKDYNNNDVKICVPHTIKYQHDMKHYRLFGVSLKSFLENQPFTYQGIAYGIINHNSIICSGTGVKDIDDNMLNVSNPEAIKYDYNNALNAISLHLKYGVNLSDKLIKCISDNRVKFLTLNKHRVKSLLLATLRSKNMKTGFEYLYKTGLMNCILPEMVKMYEYKYYNVKYHNMTVWNHTMTALENFKKTRINISNVMLISLLFHDIGKYSSHIISDDNITHNYMHDVASHQIVEKFLSEYSFDNEESRLIKILVKNHMSGIDRINKIYNDYNDKNMLNDLLRLMYFDKSASLQPFKFQKIVFLYNNIISPKIEPHELDINGNDIMLEFELKEGKLVGEILSYLYDLVVSNTCKNEFTDLLDEANAYVSHVLSTDIEE